MTIENFILQLRSKSWLHIATVYLRYLIGSAFVIAAFSMGKVFGPTLHIQSSEAPIHSLTRFFEVMANSGLYWSFIGWVQILAGFLLLTQRYARLGAVIFFPLILNIFIITLSYSFKGTPYVTGLMLLATSYLLLWEWPFLRYVIITPGHNEKLVLPASNTEQMWLWKLTGLIIFASIVLLSLIRFPMFSMMLICASEGVLSLIVYWMIQRRSTLFQNI